MKTRRMLSLSFNFNFVVTRVCLYGTDHSIETPPRARKKRLKGGRAMRVWKVGSSFGGCKKERQMKEKKEKKEEASFLKRSGINA